MIDIETLRVRAGVPAGDASKDAELQLAADQALVLCETYCDRWFELQTQVEQIWPTRGAYHLKRYPIIAVTSIIDENGATIDPATYRTVNAAGLVLRGGGAGGWPMTITYEGGYDPLPPDLEFAVLAAFDAVWASTPGWGAAAGSVAQQVQKVSIVGVGSLDFGTGGDSGGSQIGSQPWGVLPVTVTSVLQRYMNHTVIGGG